VKPESGKPAYGLEYKSGMYFRISEHTSERRADSIFKVEEYQAEHGEERRSYKEAILYGDGPGAIIVKYMMVYMWK